MNERANHTLINLDHFPCGCLITTPDRRIVFANQFFTEMLGWDPVYLLGHLVDVLLNSPTRLFCECYVIPEVFNQGRCSEVQISLLSKTGEAFPKTASVQLMPDGNLCWVFLEAANRQRLFHELEAAQQALQDQREQLELLSRTDPLTGLANRRELDACAQRILLSAKRSGVSVSVLVLDIDRFKTINDSHGHEVGDQALCGLAEVLKKTLRDTDLIARLGGDEFVCVLDNTDRDHAAVLGDCIRAAAQTVGNQTHWLTVSIGVAETPPNSTATFEDLLRLADDALYEAKAAGRNKTQVAMPKVA